MALGGPTSAETVRLSTEAFGRPVRILIRDLSASEAEAAAEAAVEALARVERLADPSAPIPPRAEEEAQPAPPANLAALNAAAGEGPLAIDPDLLELISRALSFCTWSDGAQGPLGGRLEEVWGLRQPVAQPPIPDDLRLARASAGCSQVLLDREHALASLGKGSALSLGNFAPGFAVDRAVEVLREHGVTNALVEVGRLRRALGPGKDGRGWRVSLPVFPGMSEPLDEVWLRDRSLAISHQEDYILRIGERRYAPYFHHRTGRPVEGVLAVAAVAELAVDAQGLAASLFVLGNREGQFRLGRLRPQPSVLWLLGTGEGQPLIADYHWSDINLP
jgi:thiamine biosynthesis lipoprotein